MADLDLATILADGEYLRRVGDTLDGGPGGAGVDAEGAVDATAAAFAAGTHTNVTVTYDDTAGSISLASTATGGGTVPAAVLTEPFNDFTTNGWVLGGSPTIVAGRTGTAASSGTSASNLITYTIPTVSRSDWITLGFAWQCTAALADGMNIVELYSDATATRHSRLLAHANGSLSFNREAIQLGVSRAGLVVPNTWYYIEVQARLHDTAGSAQVRVNGATVINVTGVDTKNVGTNTVFESLRLLRGTVGNANLYDDLYISIGAGATFRGDVAGNIRSVITYAATSTTGALSDAGAYLRFTGTNPTYTVPPNSSVAFPVGTQIDGIGTATAMTLIQGSGVTINRARTLVTLGAKSGWTLVKVATDEWDTHGDYV